jgi:hypothetical protein
MLGVVDQVCSQGLLLLPGMPKPCVALVVGSAHLPGARVWDDFWGRVFLLLLLLLLGRMPCDCLCVLVIELSVLCMPSAFRTASMGVGCAALKTHLCPGVPL